MFSIALNTMFNVIGIFYGLVMPLLVLHIFALFFIPSLLKEGTSNVTEIGKAAYCYLAELLGLLLLTIGGLPTMYSVLAGRPLSDAKYVALLLIFAVGGLIYLWHDSLVESVNASARKVPSALFFFTVKLIGFLAVTFSALSLLLTIILQQGPLPQDWWVMHTVVFIYGVLIWWCTSFDEGGRDLFSRSLTLPAAVPTLAKRVSSLTPFHPGKADQEPKPSKKGRKK